ncbi:MAG: pirin family protein [bacterium]
MIKKIPAADRYYNDFGSLQTYWLFSFGHYHEATNMNFGALRVFNDDVIAPGAGFPDHPHAKMEILTIILEGTLTHTDSMGNKETLTAGEVQRMSAGNHVVHSEFNRHDVPIHLYQLWFHSNQTTVTSYEQKKIVDTHPVTVLASGTKSGVVALYANATVSKLVLTPTQEAKIVLEVGWGCLIYISKGEVFVNGELLSAGDQARITKVSEILLVTDGGAQALIVEVKM